MEDNKAEVTFSRESVTVRFRHNGQLIEWTKSNARAVIDDFEVPAWVSQRRHGGSSPDMFVKVAVRDGAPQLVELSFISQPGQSEVRPKHFRAIDPDQLARDLYAGDVMEIVFDSHGMEVYQDGCPASWEVANRAATKLIELQRRPREYRRIDDKLLREVAEVYRANIRTAPTKAVAKHFVVKDRMAATYVQRARGRGFLPKTKQGKKQA